MARMLGVYERPFCSGPRCRRISYSPDCIDESRSKRASKAAERRQWMREYEVDEADFWNLRNNTGWFFLGSWIRFYENWYGEDYNDQYAEFGVTPSGWPVRRTP